MGSERTDQQAGSRNPWGFGKHGLAAAGACRQQVQPAIRRGEKAAEGEAADGAWHEDVCVDGFAEAFGRELFQPQLVSGAVIAL